MNWDLLINGNRLRPSNADPNRKGMSANLDVRNAFESDFGRVVFSAASRRLHDKTQVFPLTTDDNIHSRLTHSMEVMNIGLSFAIYLSECEEFLKKTGMNAIRVMREINPILKTACLIHDIGNPPFGHFGEEVFQNYFTKLFCELTLVLDGKITSPCLAFDLVQSLDEGQKNALSEFIKNENYKADYTCFDGNAEGLRVLLRLQYLGDLYGLNLTFGTLAASLKYPNVGLPVEEGPIAKHKHGVLATEQEGVRNIAEACGLIVGENEFKRHPLAFLMEAADSICYYVMDIEDAISKGWLNSAIITNAISESRDIAEDVKEKIFKNKKTNGGNNAPTMKDWVMLRTTLLSHLMEVATKNFINHLPEIEAGSYNKELVEDGDGVYKVLKNISLTKILCRKEIISLEVTGKAVITGLFDNLLTMLFDKNKKVRKRAKVMISKSIYKTILHEHLISVNPDIEGDEISDAYESHDPAAFSAEERFRLVRDYVACMTDKYALSQFQKISGQNI